MSISPEFLTGPPAGTAKGGLRDLLRRAARGRSTFVLADRLRFETLLSELSAGLIHVPGGEIAGGLGRALQRVGTFLDVDRGDLDENADGGLGVRLSWARPGLEEPPRIGAGD